MRAVVLLCLLPAAFCGTTGNYYWDPMDHMNPIQDTYLKCYDQASCGCCLMARQMDRMEEYFNHTADALDRWIGKAKVTLNIMRGSRSAFSVALNNASVSVCLGPSTSDMVMVYKHVFINLGGGYNVNTGVFTTPRSGVYSLALTVYGKTKNNGPLAACGVLRVNGMVVAGPSDKGLSDKEDSASVVAAVKLKAGDKVDVVLPAGCFLCDNHSHYNTFTGYLLYATDHKTHTQTN